MNLSSILADKRFFKETIRLTLPIVLQNFILSSLNLIDNIIIGALGEVAIASVGLANQYFFLLNIVLFGTVSGASIFTAQYWGTKDLKNIKRVLGLSLISAVIVSAIFMLLALLFPRQIMGIFSKDPAVIAMGGNFLRILSLSFIVTGISFTYSVTLRSIGQVKIPMLVSIMALGINTVLNIIFVYGIGSYEGMGVYGSAIATLIARLVEFTMMILVVYKFKLPVAASFKELIDLSSGFIKKFFKVTTPVIFNESFWALGVTVYSIIYAHMGTEVIAATNIVGTIDKLSMVIFFGFGNAAAIMIGKKIGEKNEEEAFLYAKRFILINTILGVFMGIIIYFAAPVLLFAYNITAQVHGYSKGMLHVLALFMWAKVFNYTNVVGILRSGGDTKYCLFLDMFGMWVVGVPLVALTGLYFHLPIQTVYIFVFVEEIAKFIIGLPRIASKKWINNLAVH